MDLWYPSSQYDSTICQGKFLPDRRENSRIEEGLLATTSLLSSWLSNAHVSCFSVRLRAKRYVRCVSISVSLWVTQLVLGTSPKGRYTSSSHIETRVDGVEDWYCRYIIETFNIQYPWSLHRQAYRTLAKALYSMHSLKTVRHRYPEQGVNEALSKLFLELNSRHPTSRFVLSNRILVSWMCRIIDLTRWPRFPILRESFQRLLSLLILLALWR